ncbi:hypothetical protein ABMA28_013912 [Loxostege sticticalis]|uniref:Ig-like domain-containing protein n=1 Tax=Loxostege sticticalis TaxID=481309 RepID=A0ABD0TJZ6_LOXSC
MLIHLCKLVFDTVSLYPSLINSISSCVAVTAVSLGTTPANRGTCESYIFDVRGKHLSEARHWSAPEVFGPRAHFSTSPPPAALVVRDVKRRDEGVYRCRVDFRNTQTTSFRYNFTVVVPPEKPVVVDRWGKVINTTTLGPHEEGQDVLLTCRVLGGRPEPSVRWLVNGVLVDEEYEHNTGDVIENRLLWPAIRRADYAAVFTCQAANSHLVPPKELSLVLDMFLRPLTVEIKKPAEIGEGGVLTAERRYEVTCESAGSRPPAVITWHKGKRLLKRITILQHATKFLISLRDVIVICVPRFDWSQWTAHNAGSLGRPRIALRQGVIAASGLLSWLYGVLSFIRNNSIRPVFFHNKNKTLTELQYNLYKLALINYLTVECRIDRNDPIQSYSEPRHKFVCCYPFHAFLSRELLRLTTKRLNLACIHLEDDTAEDKQTAFICETSHITGANAAPAGLSIFDLVSRDRRTYVQSLGSSPGFFPLCIVIIDGSIPIMAVQYNYFVGLEFSLVVLAINIYLKEDIQLSKVLIVNHYIRFAQTKINVKPTLIRNGKPSCAFPSCAPGWPAGAIGMTPGST